MLRVLLYQVAPLLFTFKQRVYSLYVLYTLNIIDITPIENIIANAIMLI